MKYIWLSKIACIVLFCFETQTYGNYFLKECCSYISEIAVNQWSVLATIFLKK